MSNRDIFVSVLSDLQKLDEAGRNRILNLLPPQSVIDLLKASLLERDRTTSQYTMSLYELELNHSKQTALHRTISRMEMRIVNPHAQQPLNMPLG